MQFELLLSRAKPGGRLRWRRHVRRAGAQGTGQLQEWYPQPSFTSRVLPLATHQLGCSLLKLARQQTSGKQGVAHTPSRQQVRQPHPPYRPHLWLATAAACKN